MPRPEPDLAPQARRKIAGPASRKIVAPQARGEISLVLPTFNRAQALRENFPAILALEGIAETIVVDDGSTDDTPSVLGGWEDQRLRVVRLAQNNGSPAARNLGAALACGTWVLFVEDDCRFPSDFALALSEEAKTHEADVVGAPMVHLRPRQSLEAALALARAQCRGPNGLDEVAGFPRRAVRTPLLPAPVLVRKSVLDELRFDEGYRGNAYREETDFFIRASRRGFTCLLTPRTYFWEEGRWGGGQSRPPFLTEYWTIRNNWRFLRRHGRWLTCHGYISSPLREQLAFVARRLRGLVRRASVDFASTSSPPWARESEGAHAWQALTLGASPSPPGRAPVIVAPVVL